MTVPFSPTEPFRPAWGLESPHAQTVFAALFRPSRLPLLQRERWETPDGDFIDLDRLPAPAERPHLLVLHGLEGSSRAGYVAATLTAAASRGWGAWAVNFRSCSGESNRTLRSYNSGDTTDARWVMQKLHDQILKGPLVGVGFSLGANVLLRLLAEDGDRCPLRAGVAICAPFDLAACMQLLDANRPMATVYRRRFLTTLRRKALEKCRRFPGALDEARIRSASTLRDFDDAVTAPMWGYSSAEDYYAQCASGPLLPAIHRPTLLLSAKDDPFIPASCFPPESVLTQNLHLTPLLISGGGHVGFVTGTPVRPGFWAEAQAISFLEQAISRD